MQVTINGHVYANETYSKHDEYRFSFYGTKNEVFGLYVGPHEFTFDVPADWNPVAAEAPDSSPADTPLALKLNEWLGLADIIAAMPDIGDKPARELAIAITAYAQGEASERDRWRAALDDECNRTDSLLTILGLPAERCRSEGGSLIPRKVLTLMAEAGHQPRFSERDCELICNGLAYIIREYPEKAEHARTLLQRLRPNVGVEPHSAAGKDLE